MDWLVRQAGLATEVDTAAGGQTRQQRRRIVPTLQRGVRHALPQVLRVSGASIRQGYTHLTRAATGRSKPPRGPCVSGNSSHLFSSDLDPARWTSPVELPSPVGQQASERLAGQSALHRRLLIQSAPWNWLGACGNDTEGKVTSSACGLVSVFTLCRSPKW